MVMVGCALVLAAACSSDDAAGNGADPAPGGGGAVAVGGAGGSVGGAPTTHPLCDGLGLPTTAFDSSPGEAVFGGLAADFTVETLAGPWTLSDNWTGCDSYVFIHHVVSFSNPVANEVWASDPVYLLQNSPGNVHYFFGGTTGGAVKGEEMKAKLDTALATLGPEATAYWEPRLHYVTTAPQEIAGSVGALHNAQGSGIMALGIDRHQRFDSGGSLSRYSGGGFAGDVRMAAYLPRYYNFAFERDAELDAESNVTTVPLIADTMVTDNNQLYSVELPDAEIMAGFDTLSFDVKAQCGPSPGDCGEWDYEAYIELCEDDLCDTRHQVALWITPYSRPGTRRWIIDGTPFLAFLRDGGTRSFRFGMLWNMNPNVMDVALRLTSNGEPRPVVITPLFTGGTFDASYNDGREPITFDVPANATKVELVAIISGHGQEAPLNCAEWCNHVHTFTLNDTAPFEKSFPGEAGAPYGCADRVDEGVVPGQYGNWAPGRAAWCPGLEVQPWRVEITDAVTLGAENTISYAGTVNGGDPQGGRIRMSSFVAIYE